MRGMAEALLLTLYLGVPVEIWDALWLVSGRGGDRYKDAFLALYHLEHGSMIVDDLPIDAIVIVDGYGEWWLGIVLWLLDPGAACLDGCPQSQRPVL